MEQESIDYKSYIGKTFKPTGITFVIPYVCHRIIIWEDNTVSVQTKEDYTFRFEELTWNSIIIE